MINKKFILVFLGMTLFANGAFCWWVFDARKQAAFETARQKPVPVPEMTSPDNLSGELYLYAASGLNNTFRELAKAFKTRHKGLNIWQTKDNNTALVKRADNDKRPPDILAVSSELALKNGFFPEKTDWMISFAANEMVLLYTPNSRYAEEINQANWSEILTREDSRYGYLDPRLDEAGSRTIFCWQLAEDYYKIKDLYLLLVKNVRRENIFNSSGELLTALNKGEVDFAFHYRTFALANGVKFITLPPETNLGNKEMAPQYRLASFKLKGNDNQWIIEKGAPITNFLTIPRSALHKEAATAFLEFCLSKEGLAIMRQNGLLPLLNREAIHNGKLPDNLRKYITAERAVKNTKILPASDKPGERNKKEAGKIERPRPPVVPLVKAPTPPAPPGKKTPK